MTIRNPNDPEADEHFYQVTAVNSVGESSPSNSASVWGLSVQKRNLDLPDKFVLEQNYPNPFNPTTEIRYELPEDSHVGLSVFNLVGQKISTLVNEQKAAGYHSAFWDGKDSFGNEVASGVYIYQIKVVPNSPGSTPIAAKRKMTLLR